MSKENQKKAEEFAYDWIRKNSIWDSHQEKLMSVLEGFAMNEVFGRPAANDPVFEVIDTETGQVMNDSLLRDMALENKDNEFGSVGSYWMDLEGFAISQDGSLYVLDEMGGWAYAPARFEVKENDE